MRVLVQNYTFDKVTKQVTLTDYPSIVLENVLLITNVTNNLCIYQANDPQKGGTVSGNTVTLDFDTNTGLFSNTDKLQIFYEEAILDVAVTSSALPLGAATESKQDSQISELQAIKGHVDSVESKLDTLISQTDGIEGTLSSIDGKVATESKQDSQIVELQAIKGHVDQVEAKLDTIISQTDGIEGTLSSIDAKVATESKQDSQIVELQAIKGHVDQVESKLDTLISQTDGIEGTLTSIDGKVSTEAKQDLANTKLDTIIAQTDGVETTLSSIDAKVSTEAKQDSQIVELQAIKGHVDQVENKLDTLITQTDTVENILNSIDAKVATEVTVATLLTENNFDQRVGEVQSTPTANTVLGRLKDVKDEVVARLGVLGQSTMSGSTPVVISSDQTDVPVSQGNAAPLTGAWPVTHTDGTNTQPTGDVVGRSIFQQISDGVVGPVSVKDANTASVATDKSIVTAFSPNSPLPVGTNEIGKIEQGTPAPLSGYWPVRVTDGVNTQPTGDVNSRAPWVRIGDGTTGPVAVMGAFSSPTPSAPSLVVQISPNQDPLPTTVVPTDAFSGNSQGRISGVGNGVFTAIRATAYVEQITDGQRSIASSNANDSSAGTGARQITIYYLDSTGAGPSLEQPFYEEVITLNGTTAVNTVATNICFIERIVVTSVGSNGSNVGTITLFTGLNGTGTAIGSIGVNNLVNGTGDNATMWAHHYTPLNFVTDVYATVGGCSAAAGGGNYVQVLRSKNPTLATSPETLTGDIITISQGNAFLRTFGSPLAISGPGRLVLYGTPGTNNTTLYGSFDFSDRPG